MECQFIQHSRGWKNVNSNVLKSVSSNINEGIIRSDGDAGGSKVLDLNDLGLNLSGCWICYFHQELRKHLVQLIDRF